MYSEVIEILAGFGYVGFDLYSGKLPAYSEYHQADFWGYMKPNASETWPFRQIEY